MDMTHEQNMAIIRGFQRGEIEVRPVNDYSPDERERRSALAKSAIDPPHALDEAMGLLRRTRRWIARIAKSRNVNPEDLAIIEALDGILAGYYGDGGRDE